MSIEQTNTVHTFIYLVVNELHAQYKFHYCTFQKDFSSFFGNRKKIKIAKEQSEALINLL